MEAICLPRLTKLQPTMMSTVLKAMEEAGELARAVLQFLPYENNFDNTDSEQAVIILAEVAGELLDVAQTCVTMLFVMEDSYEINIENLIVLHLTKLDQKGYSYDHSCSYHLLTQNSVGEVFKLLHLPRLQLENVTLLTTVCKIQEELGELSQFLGKGAAASGERDGLAQAQIQNGCALELLDVAQCCFTMMYLLAERYGVDVDALVAAHRCKLYRKGYC